MAAFPKDMDDCLKKFDEDKDGSLNQKEFNNLCQALFTNEDEKPYDVDQTILEKLFSIFDTNKDSFIDKDEFKYAWQNWIKQILSPVSALLIVDVQNDFISGSLAIKNFPDAQDGGEVVAPINQLIEEVPFDLAIYSYDWHPENHISFIENKDKYQIHKTSKISAGDIKAGDEVVFDINGEKTDMQLWPSHCVQNTWGAELHKDLKIRDDHKVVYKGTNPHVDAFSAFMDNDKVTQSDLKNILDSNGITDVYTCGICTDVCVGATANDSLEEGYRTILIESCSRGISKTNIEATKNNITDKNGIVVQSKQVKNLVNGSDRPPRLAFKRAIEIEKNLNKK